jgi:two-component system, NtrC family, sensor kinase
MQQTLSSLKSAGKKRCAECVSNELAVGHAQKLESVGRLAAGVAHEINTPIQFIGDSVYFLRDAILGLVQLLEFYRGMTHSDEASLSETSLQELVQAEEDADVSYLVDHVPGAIDRALDGVKRVASIVQAMREFAHPDLVEMGPADLNRALRSTLEVARNEYKYIADVEVCLAEIPQVICHVGDLNQVFLNLIINAVHAITDLNLDNHRGKIKVLTFQEGDHVTIQISDSGCGIPAAIHDKIFDPFFTTKEVGRGTGQGLAIARALVVEKHRGSITFESKLNQGTTFYIRLPTDCRPSVGGRHANERR